MDSTSAKRYIGLDIGRSGARLCYTSFDPDTRTCLEPRAVMFDNSPQIPAAIGLQAGNPVVFSNRTSLINWLNQPQPGKEFYCTHKDDLLGSSPLASQAIEALTIELLAKLKSNLNIQQLASDTHSATLGIPVAWGDAPEAIQRFTTVVSAGPLKEVHTQNEASAAVLYAIFKGLLPVEERQQTWLVIDTAGIETRFSAVTKSSGIHDLQVDDFFTLPWGGEQIDQALYTNFLLPNYWKQPEEPDAVLKIALLHGLRGLKERYALEGIAFGSLINIREMVELSQETFESDAVCRPLILEFANSLLDERLTRPAFQCCEKILLVGGGGRWSFVRQALLERWGVEMCVFPGEPELAVTRGLALTQTEFELTAIGGTGMEIAVSTSTDGPLPPEPNIDEFPSEPPPPPVLEDARRLKAKFHTKSRQVMLWCVIAGAIFALIVSPIPCAAWPVLLLLEAYMLYAIAKIYGYSLTQGVVVTMLGGLLAISFVLSLVVGEMVTILSAYLAAPIVKPIVAALVIWGLGEAAIAILDKQRFH